MDFKRIGGGRMKIILLNPYYEEQIEVKENLDYFNQCYRHIMAGDEYFIRLTQTKCERSGSLEDSSDERVIFINPRHWAKVEVIND